MSDMWQVPADLADRVRDADYTDAWKREIERATLLRIILTDLIAGLRAVEVGDCIPQGDVMDAETVHDVIDRAEARLREVTGDE